MKIEINRFIVIVAIVMVLGYLTIFISVVTQPIGSSSQLRLDFDATLNGIKKKIASKDQEIEILQSKIASLSMVHHPNAVRPGVIVLGMHRSGTSVLGGLINKMGLKTGGPLIQAAEDNAKGFFERIDVVLQNDNIMKNQRIHYSLNTYRYDVLKGLADILNNMHEGTFFNEGKRGLAFLNDERNYPWMLKDPRLCITFRSWLPLLNFIPVILFTYRHPMDVALSMNKREYEQFEISKGLKLWYVYNRMAVEQSHDLCRVTTSHRLIMKQPQIELDRIFDELNMCGLKVPKRASESDVKDFIDIKLQHGRTTLKDTSCEEDIETLRLPSSWETSNEEEISLYRTVMKAYCAMEDGSAYHPDFKWDTSIHDN